MADINTLAEEAKAAARKHAPNAHAIIVAIDTLAEAHQAEVARLTNEAENVRRKWLGHRDTGHLSLVEAADHVVGGLHADIDRLTRENEGLARINAELLDQMHHFANADQRLWDESQRDPESFIRWVRSRAAHLLAKFTARNPGACSVTDGEAKK